MRCFFRTPTANIFEIDCPVTYLALASDATTPKPGDPRIFFAESVPLSAMRFAFIDPPHILSHGAYLEVLWIHAAAIAANVIDHKSRRNRAMSQFPCHAMRALNSGCALMDTELSIPAIRSPGNPDPTRVTLIYFRPKTRGYIDSQSHAADISCRYLPSQQRSGLCTG